MVGLGDPLVALVYERGAFDHEAAQRVGTLLMAYGIGMPAYLGRDVLVRVFYALGDGTTPFRFSMAGIGLNALFDWLLVGAPTPWGLRLPALNFGAPGLVLATVLVNIATCGALLLALRHRLGGLPLLQWFQDTLRLFGAAVVMAVVAWSASRWLGGPGSLLQPLVPGLAPTPSLVTRGGWVQSLGGLSLELLVGGGLAIVTYWLLARLSGVPEANQLFALVLNRLPRRRRS